ncbi:MAG TPA: hypothetical protein VFV49_01135 [Thermoanaerobaculia bacterium]|nr:hypothetical protein [Thermoanaerobaculia bacterium]
MSQNNNVTATIVNNSGYNLTYDTQNVDWGYVTINANTVDSGTSSQQAFYAVGAQGSGTGCSGNVTYTFTDGNGNQQDVTFYYDDPYIGSNSFSITVPPGMTQSASGPSKGDSVTVSYTIGGSVS